MFYFAENAIQPAGAKDTMVKPYELSYTKYYKHMNVNMFPFLLILYHIGIFKKNSSKHYLSHIYLLMPTVLPLRRELSLPQLEISGKVVIV